MRQVWFKHVAVAVVLAAAGTSGSFTAEAQQQRSQSSALLQDGVVSAFTEPSKRADLAFAIPSSDPAVVREVFVKEGEKVTKGQKLVILDDRSVQAQLKAQELEANSSLRVDAAVADLDVKKLELERMDRIFKSGGGNDLERETAEAAVLVRKIQVDIEKLTQQIRQAQAEQIRARAEQMTMSSPIDGTVERLDLLPGELPDFGKPVCIVVSNSPLWVNAFVPAEKAGHLREGMEVPVVYGKNSPQPGKTVKGKLIYVSNVVDPASGSRRLKLELQNDEGYPSGLDVTLQITPPATAASN